MSDLPTRPGSRVLRAADAARWIDGFAFIEAAHEEARCVRENSAQWLEQARAEGFEHARQEGAERAAALLAQTSAEVDRYLAGLETSLAELALGIARQVLGEIDERERLLRCTAQALAAFRQDQALTLHVPGTEVEGLRQHLAHAPLPLHSLSIEGDDQLEAGQARLGGPAGSVELGLEAQLDNLRRALLPLAEGDSR
ncbi:type III secretion protein [Pseudomonas savastanoi pv. retacarpa]|uniref:Type III secretion protein n=10 Tax=Pseudomonas syringae group TaxID=136849 RepID=A0A2K4WVK7_PSESX|nr:MULTISPECIES: FliH/SctL family protein [Pseudomonas]KPX08072.1 Type III secretion system cytoplasmic protein [Pseudomonas syringae pv. cunninghamiae]ARD12609.1 type III secretion protein [Pseudomonas savastanoi pv. savastanoi NCPPB 3335]AVB14723.1 HrpE/YscL family type III secretion apparatus protein [Pseudomonas amygdali pv. morsprunorum]EGH03346.1 type III secretion component [Pseudomonas amygdali pv. aesculi str. 0893_23]KAA3544334.1 HrpE/YscL family type III secretion apparatus protein 